MLTAREAESLDLDNDVENGIIDGEIHIRNEDMRSFFKPCVDQIIDMLQGQCLQVESDRSVVRSIFMSGGFSNSDFLLSRVRSFARLRRIEVQRGPRPQAAVILGAVAKGMGFNCDNETIVTPCVSVPLAKPGTGD